MYLIFVSILFETTALLILDYNIVDRLTSSIILYWTVGHATIASDIFDAKVSRRRIIIMGMIELIRISSFSLVFPFYVKDVSV